MWGRLIEGHPTTHAANANRRPAGEGVPGKTAVAAEQVEQCVSGGAVCQVELW